jgi:hypothetical protein
MREIQRVGPYLEIVEARSPENRANVFKVGLRRSVFEKLAGTSQTTKCAQFYGLIQPGLLDAVHAFRGLKRPLMRANNMSGDADVIAYSWRPEHDYTWSGNRFDGTPMQKSPPPGVVFVVLVHLYGTPEEYPSHGKVWGSIEHWSWINGDPRLRFAPTAWDERYEDHLWSREL